MNHSKSIIKSGYIAPGDNEAKKVKMIITSSHKLKGSEKELGK